MPDEMNIIGVPGINDAGVITPFTPNPPWIYLAPGSSGSNWFSNVAPVTQSNVAGSVCRYYKDVFGNIHFEGAVSAIYNTTPGNYYNLAFLDINTAPTQTIYFPSQTFDASNLQPPAPSAAIVPRVTMRVAAFGAYAIIQAAFNTTGAFTGVYVFKLDWSTT